MYLCESSIAVRILVDADEGRVALTPMGTSAEEFITPLKIEKGRKMSRKGEEKDFTWESGSFKQIIEKKRERDEIEDEIGETREALWGKELIVIKAYYGMNSSICNAPDQI